MAMVQVGLGRRRAAVAVIAASVLLLGACADSEETVPPANRPVVHSVVNYRLSHPEWLTRNHLAGHLTYQTSPPVGGDHNQYWQNCNGDVYTTDSATPVRDGSRSLFLGIAPTVFDLDKAGVGGNLPV